jgi:hypothetical protein
MQLFRRSHKQRSEGGVCTTKQTEPGRLRRTTDKRTEVGAKTRKKQTFPKAFPRQGRVRLRGFLHRPPPPADRQTSRPRRIGPSPPRARGEHSVCRLKRRGDGAHTRRRKVCPNTKQSPVVPSSCHSPWPLVLVSRLTRRCGAPDPWHLTRRNQGSPLRGSRSHVHTRRRKVCPNKARPCPLAATARGALCSSLV